MMKSGGLLSGLLAVVGLAGIGRVEDAPHEFTNLVQGCEVQRDGRAGGVWKRGKR